MHIIQIANDEDKKRIIRNILEELPEWFGIPEAREEYIRDSAGKVFFCAMENEKDLGFLYLKETGKDTVELAVMGVLKEYHRKGIGKELFNRAKKAAKEMGYSFIQVKTVQMGKYKSYEAGRKILCKRFSTKSRMVLKSRADSGLNPLVTESHGGQNGMRAGTA